MECLKAVLDEISESSFVMRGETDGMFFLNVKLEVNFAFRGADDAELQHVNTLLKSRI
jgi:hypothetical protein